MSATESRNDYRAECFAAGGEEAPFWIPVETPEGDRRRDEAEALRLVAAFWGEVEGVDDPWAIGLVQMYVYADEYDDLRVCREHRDGASGPYEFWAVDER